MFQCSEQIPGKAASSVYDADPVLLIRFLVANVSSLRGRA